MRPCIPEPSLVDRVDRAHRIVDRRLTRPAKWSGPISRELRGRNDPMIRRCFADAFNWLGELVMRGDNRLTVDLCLNLHDYVMSSEGAALRKGAVRTGGVRIGSLRDFPKANDVPALLEDLLARSDSSAELPAVGSAALHLDLMLLHPFADGNGRIARLLAAFLLMRSGFRSTLLTAVDQHIACDPARYARSLRRVNTGEWSRSQWVEAAVQAMAEHVRPIVDLLVAFDGGDDEPSVECVRLDGARSPEFVAGQSGTIRSRLRWQLERLCGEESSQGVANPRFVAHVDACMRSLSSDVELT